MRPCDNQPLGADLPPRKYCGGWTPFFAFCQVTSSRRHFLFHSVMPFVVHFAFNIPRKTKNPAYTLVSRV
jgi:hypothetical protein